MYFLKSIYHFLLAWLGAVIYRHPSRALTVIGVTGTKGKSTAVELMNALFESAGPASTRFDESKPRRVSRGEAGETTAFLSSVYVKVGAERVSNRTDTTMPGRFFIQKFLRRAVGAGCRYVFIEVTSQGVLQHRHRFIAWDAAVFLNLHPEHIEAHGSYEAYREAKISFFRYVAERSPKPRKVFVVNEMQSDAVFFKKAVEGRGETVPYSGEKDMPDLARENAWFALPGNREDAAAAAAVARSFGITASRVRDVLVRFQGLPGRFEWIQREPFGVVIDYAHTPQSLKEVYQTLRNSKLKTQNSKLICVLGSAGGGRDAWKRSEFGKIAVEYCDHVILTDEDPYDENPEAIIGEIASGFSQIRNPNIEIRNVIKILNRKEAIEKAVTFAGAGDVVVITGKGSESWIHVARGKKIPWSERAAVEAAIDRAVKTRP